MSTRLAEAIALAAKAHKDQIDKQGEPYILHPLRVMMALKEDGYSEDYQIAGVLHDVVEDTPITVAYVRERFGPAVGDAVEALTHEKGCPYLDYVREIRKLPIATEVKKRDLTDNAYFRRFFHGVKYEKYAKAMAILMGQAD